MELDAITTRKLHKYIDNNITAEEIFSKMFTNNYDLTLRYRLGSGSYTDGSKITIDPTMQGQNIIADIDTMQEATRIMGWNDYISFLDKEDFIHVFSHALLIHECLHIKYSDFPLKIGKEENLSDAEKRLLAMVNNIIEDAYIEAIGSTVYDNLDRYLQFLRISCSISDNKRYATLKEAIKSGLIPEQPPLTRYINYMIERVLYPLSHTIELTEDIRPAVDATLNRFFKATTLASPEERYQAAKKLVKKIEEYFNIEQEAKPDFTLSVYNGSQKNSPKRKGQSQKVEKSLFGNIKIEYTDKEIPESDQPVDLSELRGKDVTIYINPNQTVKDFQNNSGIMFPLEIPENSSEPASGAEEKEKSDAEKESSSASPSYTKKDINKSTEADNENTSGSESSTANSSKPDKNEHQNEAAKEDNNKIPQKAEKGSDKSSKQKNGSKNSESKDKSSNNNNTKNDKSNPIDNNELSEDLNSSEKTSDDKGSEENSKDKGLTKNKEQQKKKENNNLEPDKKDTSETVNSGRTGQEDNQAQESPSQKSFKSIPEDFNEEINTEDVDLDNETSINEAYDSAGTFPKDLQQTQNGDSDDNQIKETEEEARKRLADIKEKTDRAEKEAKDKDFCRQLKDDLREAKSTQIKDHVSPAYQDTETLKNYHDHKVEVVKTTPLKCYKQAYSDLVKRNISLINKYNKRFKSLLRGRTTISKTGFTTGLDIDDNAILDRNRKFWIRKESARYIPEIAIQLLIDCSGSMEGTKITQAANAAVVLHEILQNEQIPHSVTGFTTKSWHGPLHKIFIDYNSKPNDKYNLMDIKAGGSNYDDDAIMWSISRIRKRKEEHKVIIIISDGEPCSISKEELKRLVKKQEKAGYKIITIALGGEYLFWNLKNIYTNVIHCGNSLELPEKLAKEINKVIK